jgi:hypothetical protein
MVGAVLSPNRKIEVAVTTARASLGEQREASQQESLYHRSSPVAWTLSCCVTNSQLTVAKISSCIRRPECGQRCSRVAAWRY